MLIDKISGIYLISHLDSGKVYVGSSVNCISRIKKHKSLLSRNKHYNTKLQNAWNKYKETNFSFEIIEKVPPRLLMEREQCWMDSYDVIDVGYNLTPNANSNLGFKHSDETKRKLSLIQLKKVISVETRLKLSTANKNKKREAEVIARIAKANRGKKRSAEICAMISKKLQGRKLTDTHKENIANGITGQIRSEKHKYNLSLARAKIHKFVNPKNELIIITNLKKFCLDNNLDSAGFWAIKNGKYKQYKGWTKYNG